MSEAEVHALFDRLFPRGFAGQDVLDEIAPEGWERSPLLACFHPSIERIFEERLLIRRNLEELRRMRRRRDGATVAESSPEPTLEDVRKDRHDFLKTEGNGCGLDLPLPGTRARRAAIKRR